MVDMNWKQECWYFDSSLCTCLLSA